MPTTDNDAFHSFTRFITSKTKKNAPKQLTDNDQNYTAMSEFIYNSHSQCGSNAFLLSQLFYAWC